MSRVRTSLRPAHPDVADDELLREALQVGRMIIGRLSDMDLVATCIERALATPGAHFGWSPSSLGAGYTGIALSVVENLPALGEEEAAEARGAVMALLRMAVEDTAQHPVERAGLHTGTAGLAFTLLRATTAEPRYAPTWRRAHDALLSQTDCLSPVRREEGTSFFEFDLIDGAAGVLLYLLAVGDDPATDAARRTVLDFLIWITAVAPDAVSLPRWYTPPGAYPGPQYHDAFPGGLLNLGLSHGLPGVVVALSRAVGLGHRTDEVRGAVERSVAWLERTRTDAGWDWAVGVGEDRLPVVKPNHGAMDAWCYGDAGVSLALRHAGDALGSHELARSAEAAFEASAERYLGAPSTLSPTVCHGDAGMALLTSFFADRGHPEAAGWARAATRRVLDKCDPSTALGVQDKENGGALVDDPTLLTGAAGVARTLLHVSATTRPGALLPFLGE